MKARRTEFCRACLRRTAPDGTTNQILQGIDTERLVDPSVGNPGEKLCCFWRECAARHEDELLLLAGAIQTDRVVEVRAAEFGHHEITEDDVVGWI